MIKMYLSIFATILSHTVAKIGDVFSHLWAWVIGLGLFTFEAVTGQKLIINTVIILTVLDAVWGIAVAVKRKEFTLSELMRQTVYKFLVYGTVLLAFILMDRAISDTTTIELSVTSGIAASLICVCELWSSSASMLILFPRMPFLRALRKAMKGEMANKLDCEPDEVEKILSGARKPQGRDKHGRFISTKKKKNGRL